MKWSLLVALLLASGAVVSSPSAAQQVAACGCYCGKVIRPPCSDNACKQACGWRAPSTSGSQPSYDANADASAAAAAAAEADAERERQAEAERQRQREAEEQRLREEEEAKQRQAEFERKKQETLNSMKGIAEGELGLKGLGDTNDLGLKGLGDPSNYGLKDASSSPRPSGCQWGDQGVAVVDLRCLGLDPDKPIALDPHVVRGQERVFPAQVDLTTLEDPNYKKGIEAEMHFDLASSAAAVQYFKQALLSHPNDPLVRNALLLAQDILTERTQRQQQADEQSELGVLHSLVALTNGDLDAASEYVKHTEELAPANQDIHDLALSIGVMSSNFKNAFPIQDLGTVEKLVGNAYLAEGLGYYRTEVGFMEKARQLDQNDAYVGGMLARARYLSSKYPDLAPATNTPK